MGAKSQAKGRRAELEVVSLLQAHGFDVRPGDPLNFGKEPDLSGLDGVHVEIKRAEALRLSEWMAQAERDAQRFQDGAPAVFFRRSREPWAVVMRLTDWLRLYAAASGKNQENAGKEVSNDGTAKTGSCGAANLSEQGGSSGGSGRHRQNRTKLFE